MVIADILGPDLIIVIVVAVIVLLFGGSKLPKLARGLGSASHEFKKGLDEGAADSKAETLPPAQAAPPVTTEPAQSPSTVPPAVPAPPVEPPKDSSAG